MNVFSIGHIRIIAHPQSRGEGKIIHLVRISVFPFALRGGGTLVFFTYTLAQAVFGVQNLYFQYLLRFSKNDFFGAL